MTPLYLQPRLPHCVRVVNRTGVADSTTVHVVNADGSETPLRGVSSARVTVEPRDMVRVELVMVAEHLDITAGEVQYSCYNCLEQIDVSPETRERQAIAVLHTLGWLTYDGMVGQQTLIKPETG